MEGVFERRECAMEPGKGGLRPPSGILHVAGDVSGIENGLHGLVVWTVVRVRGL